MSEDIPEFAEAMSALLAFRQKIFNNLVSGRVKAKLNANHETLQRYADVIDSLTIAPYLIDNVKQKALALQLGVNNIGTGKISQAKLSYVGATENYPKTLDSQVPTGASGRLLPAVSTFVMHQTDALSVVEASNAATWGNLFCVQSGSGGLSDSPNLSNSFYDYYAFSPVGRFRCNCVLTSGRGEFKKYSSINGEATQLVASSGGYTIYVIVDGHFVSSDQNTIAVVPMAVVIPAQPSGAGSVTFLCAGKHVQSDDTGLFVSFAMEGQKYGFCKTHDGVSISSGGTVWTNKTTLTVKVNDVALGYTDPAVGSYEKQAVESATITAHPANNCFLDHWTVDGNYAGMLLTITVNMSTNRVVEAIFTASNFKEAIPNGDVDITQVQVSGKTHGWEAVSDIGAPNDTAWIIGQIVQAWDIAKFTLDVPIFNYNDQFDYVEYWALVKANNGALKGHFKPVLRIDGMWFIDDPIEFPNDGKWYGKNKRYLVNPATNASWTPTTVNALAAGIQLQYDTSGSIPNSNVYCTVLYLHIVYHQ
jgi:hypothetical protein